MHNSPISTLRLVLNAGILQRGYDPRQQRRRRAPEARGRRTGGGSRDTIRSGSMNIADYFFFQNLNNLSFLLSLHNKVFHIEKLHDRNVYSWLHSGLF
jgi:hypothetical protein